MGSAADLRLVISHTKQVVRVFGIGFFRLVISHTRQESCDILYETGDTICVGHSLHDETKATICDGIMGTICFEHWVLRLRQRVGFDTGIGICVM